jgi:hypothetical protein
MSAFIIMALVVGLLVGGIMTLRSSAKTGMPSKEVLDRATERARELEARDKAAGAADEEGNGRRG